MCDKLNYYIINTSLKIINNLYKLQNARNNNFWYITVVANYKCVGINSSIKSSMHAEKAASLRVVQIASW